MSLTAIGRHTGLLTEGCSSCAQVFSSPWLAARACMALLRACHAAWKRLVHACGRTLTGMGLAGTLPASLNQLTRLQNLCAPSLR